MGFLTFVLVLGCFPAINAQLPPHCAAVICPQPKCLNSITPRGQCCPICTDSRDKPGRCPPVLPGTVGICVEDCTSDYECPGRQKCCSNGCGHVCRRPVNGGSSYKPGRCPRVLPGTVGICVEECRSDYECPGRQKCCSNGCGHVCMIPVTGGRY